MEFIICNFCGNRNIIREDRYISHCLVRHNEIITEIELQSINKLSRKAASRQLKLAREKINNERMQLNNERLQFEENLKREKEIYEREEYNKYLKNNTFFKSYSWDDFIFGNNELIFPIEKTRKIINPIRLFGVNPSLNLIKDTYFKRLYDHAKLNFTIFEHKILPEKSNGYQIIKNSIEFAYEFLSFSQFDIKKIGKLRAFENLSKDSCINILKQYKNKYIDYLAINQTETMKIIPILEYINGIVEQSLIFRIITKSEKLLLIWENINENRATHLFLTDIELGEEKLMRIEEFLIRNDIRCKRSTLYDISVSSNSFKNDLSYIGHINHTNLNEYCEKLRQYWD